MIFGGKGRVQCDVNASQNSKVYDENEEKWKSLISCKMTQLEKT